MCTSSHPVDKLLVYVDPDGAEDYNRVSWVMTPGAGTFDFEFSFDG